MIDWTTFVESLDDENFIELSGVVHSRKKEMAEEVARGLVLSFPEVSMIRNGLHHEAMLRINNRLKCGILVARAAVDLQIAHDEDEEALREVQREEEQLLEDWEKEGFEDETAREDGGEWPPHGEAADDHDVVIGVEQPFVD